MPAAAVVDAAIQWKPPIGRPAGIAGSPRRAISFCGAGGGSGDTIDRKRPEAKSHARGNSRGVSPSQRLIWLAVWYSTMRSGVTSSSVPTSSSASRGPVRPDQIGAGAFDRAASRASGAAARESRPPRRRCRAPAGGPRRSAWPSTSTSRTRGVPRRSAAVRGCRRSSDRRALAHLERAVGGAGDLRRDRGRRGVGRGGGARRASGPREREQSGQESPSNDRRTHGLGIARHLGYKKPAHERTNQGPRRAGVEKAGGAATGSSEGGSRRGAREGGAPVATVAGTVAILGRPNVGKSTLLNHIVGEKLAIVTPKPQTTRNRIVGVWNGAGGQIVFVDTPGVHGARKGLNRYMVGEALAAIADVDAALLVVDGSDGKSGAGDAERMILDGLADAKKPVVLAVNKVDRVKDKTAHAADARGVGEGRGGSARWCRSRRSAATTSTSSCARSAACCPRASRSTGPRCSPTAPSASSRPSSCASSCS